MKTYPGKRGPETQEVMDKLFLQTKLRRAQFEVNLLWNLMCAEEGVPTDSKFVAFNSDNKYSDKYNSAVKKFFRLQAQATRYSGYMHRNPTSLAAR